MISIITKIQLPIIITRNLPDTKLEPAAIDSLIDERLRLHPDTTKVFEIAEPGHLEGFNFQSAEYLANLNSFWIFGSLIRKISSFSTKLLIKHPMKLLTKLSSKLPDELIDETSGGMPADTFDDAISDTFDEIINETPAETSTEIFDDDF